LGKVSPPSREEVSFDIISGKIYEGERDKGESGREKEERRKIRKNCA
jgi:hypothetical protein